MLKDTVGEHIQFFEEWVRDGMPTLKVFGAKHGVTAGRVHQKLSKAAVRLKHPSRSGHPMRETALKFLETRGKGGISKRIGGALLG